LQSLESSSASLSHTPPQELAFGATPCDRTTARTLSGGRRLRFFYMLPANHVLRAIPGEWGETIGLLYTTISPSGLIFNTSPSTITVSNRSSIFFNS